MKKIIIYRAYTAAILLFMVALMIFTYKVVIPWEDRRAEEFPQYDATWRGIVETTNTVER